MPKEKGWEEKPKRGVPNSKAMKGENEVEGEGWRIKDAGK